MYRVEEEQILTIIMFPVLHLSYTMFVFCKSAIIDQGEG